MNTESCFQASEDPSAPGFARRFEKGSIARSWGFDFYQSAPHPLGLPTSHPHPHHHCDHGHDRNRLLNAECNDEEYER